MGFSEQFNLVNSGAFNPTNDLKLLPEQFRLVNSGAFNPSNDVRLL